MQIDDQTTQPDEENTPVRVGTSFFQLPTLARRKEAIAWIARHGHDENAFRKSFPDAILTIGIGKKHGP